MMKLSDVVWRCVQVLAVLAVPVTSTTNTSHCPTWFHYSNSTQSCQCGFEAEWLHCDPHTTIVRIRSGFCVSKSSQEGLYYVNYCPLRYRYNSTDRLYCELPTDPDMLEKLTCNPYNRQGFSCSECIEGYGPGVYTFDKTCADCSEFSIGFAVFLYVLADLVPITLFFISVIVFRVDVTAGPLLGYVIFCQEFSVSLEYDPTIYNYIHSQLPKALASLLKVLLMLFEVWNTSVLKPVIPPFCISDKMTGIHVLLLNSFSALYPVLLVIVSMLVIELHAENKFVCVLLKPFGYLLKKVNVTTITSDAIIRAFATFIFLSSIKNLFAFYAMTRSTKVYRSTDGSVYKEVLYSDSTVEYLSHSHIILMVIPLVQCLFLVFIPSALLFVYPTRLYRLLSRCISARKQLVITTFVESLNGCFKNGLKDTRDYRSVAGVLIFGLPLFSVWILIIEVLIDDQYNMNILYCFVASLLSLLLSYTRPLKSTAANASTSFYFLLFAVANIVAYLWYEQIAIPTWSLELAFSLIGISSQAPVVLWAVYHISRYARNKIFTRRFVCCSETCLAG